MNYKREYLVGVVDNVFEDRDIVWPSNGTIEKANNINLFKEEEKLELNLKI